MTLAPTPAVAGTVPLAPGSVDWPAVLAGTVLASALSVVLLTFGSAVGLSAVSAEPGEGISLAWLSIASGIWFVWVAISSFAAGGYLAGRMRRPVAEGDSDDVETRDGAHGLLVWATGALVGALLVTAGVGGLAGATARSAGSVADVAAEAASGDVGAIANRLIGPGGEEAREAVQNVIMRALADGEISAEDRTYVAEIIAQRTEATPEEAAAQVDAAVAQAREIYDAAIETAETARAAAAIAAFVVAATLMASAAAAYFAAATGGDHRDRRLPFRNFGR